MVNTYTESVVVSCILSSSNAHKTIFGQHSAVDPTGRAYNSWDP